MDSRQSRQRDFVTTLFQKYTLGVPYYWIVYDRDPNAPWQFDHSTREGLRELNVFCLLLWADLSHSEGGAAYTAFYQQLVDHDMSLLMQSWVDLERRDPHLIKEMNEEWNVMRILMTELGFNTTG